MHPLVETHRAELLALARSRGVTGVLAHMRDCLSRIHEYTNAER
jgi:hypothetical protein